MKLFSADDYGVIASAIPNFHMQDAGTVHIKMQGIDIGQTIDIVFRVVGGLALFMYAMYLMRETLGKVSGARVTRILEKVSSNPVKGMGAGTVATILTQSSSITVLTLIGFVNAGILTFRQSVNIMLGSEIGTTAVAQIVAFDIGLTFWPLLTIGFIVSKLSKKERYKLFGDVAFSMGMLFLAMDFIKQGAEELMSHSAGPAFIEVMAAFGTNPVVGILVGAAIAGITQSSAATVGLVIALGRGGLIELPAAIALVLGANIGTCFLELFAGIGATSPAKRTALAQAMINVVGVTMFFPFLGPFAGMISGTSSDLPRQIANAHTVFNVIVSFLFIPLVGLLVRFCEFVIRDKPGEVIGRRFFDDEMLYFAQAALFEAERELTKTAGITLEMIQTSRVALLERNVEQAQRVIKMEDDVNESCQAIERFIGKIKEEQLSEKDSQWRMKLLAVNVDVERIGDLASNIAEFALDKVSRGIVFSNAGISDLQRMFHLAEDTYSMAIESLKTRDKSLARQAGKLEEQIDAMERELTDGHIARMEAGICNPQADTVFVETVRNLERIGDHADNIALDVIVEY